MNDQAVHLGVAWKFRDGRRTEDAVVHAVVRPEGVTAERLPDGRISWDKPWRRVCDGGPADERRYGWASDVTCTRCRRAGEKKITPLHVSGYLARKALLEALAAYDVAGLPATQAVRGNLITAALYLAPFKEPPEGYENDEPVEGPEDWFGVL